MPQAPGQILRPAVNMSFSPGSCNPMKPIVIFCATLLATALLCGNTAYGQGIPPDQWTAKEQQFVDGTRNLHRQQGAGYSNEQASQAVMQMRQLLLQTTPLRGVPEPEWTAQERGYMDAAKRELAALGAAFTAEQGRLAVQTMRDQIARTTGALVALKIATTAATSPGSSFGNAPERPTAGGGAGSVTEEQLATTVRTWPGKNSGMEMRDRRDGFDINGKPVLDSEGRMTSYAYDVTTGTITYAVRTSRGMSIKMPSVSNLSTPLVIANATQTGDGWEVLTVTGKRFSGETLTVLSDGFLVGRPGSAFRYAFSFDRPDSSRRGSA